MSALDVLGALVIEDGRRWAEAAADWQRADAVAVLVPESDGPRMHYLTRPRGGSKTSDVAGMSLAALIEQFPPRAQGYVFAVDADQAALLVDAAAGFVGRSGLGGLVKVEAKRIINLRTDAAVNVLAADGGSAFGLRPYWQVADEFSQWREGANERRLWEAILSGVPKVADGRLIVVTSAGDPAHPSARVLERAKASPKWRVNEVPGPVPWISTEDLDEQRRLLTESQYARLHLNVWTAPDDRLTSVDDVRACILPGAGVRAPEPGIAYVIGLDIGVRNDRTVAAVCSLATDDDGEMLVVLDAMQVWAPSRDEELNFAEVEAWLIDTARAYNGAEVVFDPYAAVHLAQRLRVMRIRCHEFTFSVSGIGRIATTLYRLLREHRLDLPDDPRLVDELAHVRLRETGPGAVRIDHDSARHDDRAIALGLAAQHLLAAPNRRKLRYRGAA